MGQEFGRDLEAGVPPGEDGLAELQRQLARFSAKAFRSDSP